MINEMMKDIKIEIIRTKYPHEIKEEIESTVGEYGTLIDVKFATETYKYNTVYNVIVFYK